MIWRREIRLEIINIVSILWSKVEIIKSHSAAFLKFFLKCNFMADERPWFNVKTYFWKFSTTSFFQLFKHFVQFILILCKVFSLKFRPSTSVPWTIMVRPWFSSHVTWILTLHWNKLDPWYDVDTIFQKAAVINFLDTSPHSLLFPLDHPRPNQPWLISSMHRVASFTVIKLCYT